MAPVPDGATTSTRLYLVRHSRTALNAAGLLRGHLDPELDAVGVRQAAVLGDVLARQELKLVVSSPLRRAVETARDIADRAGLQVEVDPRFIDRDYGPWAGEARGEVVDRFGSLDAAPGVERMASVRTRVLDGLADVTMRCTGGQAVVVSHDVLNRFVLSELDGRLGSADTVPQDTGCFNVLERRGPRWSVVSVNNAPAGHDG